MNDEVRVNLSPKPWCVVCLKDTLGLRLVISMIQSLFIFHLMSLSCEAADHVWAISCHLQAVC